MNPFRNKLRLLPVLSVVVSLALLVPAAVCAVETNSAPAADALSAGRKFMAHGNFDEAEREFERVERNLATSGDTASRLNSLQALAEARQALGKSEQAATALDTAIALATAGRDEHRIALLKAQLGGAYLHTGRDDLARPLLVAALEAARVQQNRTLVAAILNDLGSLHQIAGDRDAAHAAYDEARRLAEELDNPGLAIRVLLNAAALEIEARQPRRAHQLARAAQTTVGQLEAQPLLRAQAQIWIGAILSEVARLDSALRKDALQAAYTTLNDARHQADRLKELRLQSAASGALGGIYLQTGSRENALTLTRDAIGKAQRAGATDLLFRWHWQAARIHSVGADPDLAITSYRHALAAYEASRLAPQSPGMSWPASRPSRAIFLEFTDLLLRKSHGMSTADAQTYLVEARDAVEKLKAQELQDYFHDSCVTEARARVQGLVQNLGPRTAVLYPIVLPDRLELLLNLGAEIKLYTVTVRDSEVISSTRRFRESIESQRTRNYLDSAQTLYRWLIKPIEADLTAAQIETLVTIPDHALRAIPMAALHDGERFLVQRLAVVMAPGLELTDPRPLPARAARVLLVGLSESAQGFPALLHVNTELNNIHGYFPGRVLKNASFARDALEQALTREHYHIAHIASHGEFSGDVRASFVLAHDGKLSVNDLARFIGVNRLRDDPLDLLTLSACQTAAGDERAALGLAGLTVRAGARSALASLWPIHDEATSLLMTEFYRQLRTPGVSKAQALRRAQQQLAEITRYRHPGYWSGFVLIGNWL